MKIMHEKDVLDLKHHRQWSMTVANSHDDGSVIWVMCVWIAVLLTSGALVAAIWVHMCKNAVKLMGHYTIDYFLPILISFMSFINE